MAKDIKDFKDINVIKEIKGIKGKKWLKDFRDFAVKGNVVDLSVAVVIGAAFGKIISSLVADIVMPIVGILIGGVDFSSWKLTLKDASLNNSGIIVKQAVTMNIGTFIQNIFDFFVIAWAVFIMVKVINRLKRQLIKEETEEKKEEVPTPLSKDQELLTEIRDLLKKEKE
jgi:large conductance mechanosensitive channel